MVDSNDRDRISDAARELGRLLSDDSMIPAGCPLLVIANKQGPHPLISIFQGAYSGLGMIRTTAQFYFFYRSP